MANPANSPTSLTGPDGAQLRSSRDYRLETAARLKPLYVAAVCDILDSLGYRDQAMHQRLRPLLPDRHGCGFIGWARTLRWMPVDHVDEEPYAAEIEAMDSLRPGDVVVHSTDPLGTNAPWGELMTLVAIRNGAAGCICDSNIRDAARIIDLGFPVYCAGIRPLDSKGRGIVKAYDVPVRCGDVLVHPGDLIFADYDGVVVIPRPIEDQALRLALDKVEKEDGVRAAVERGRTLRQAYEQFGVL